MNRHQQVMNVAPPTAKVLKNVYQKCNNDSPRAKELTKAVGYFIAKDLMPTSVVQVNGFRKLLEKLEPHYQLPSRVRESNPYNV